MNCFCFIKTGRHENGCRQSLSVIRKKILDEEEAKVTFFRLQPLADVHFNPLFGGVINKKYLWALALRVSS